jgi:ATP-dependent Lhr-like helicase
LLEEYHQTVEAERTVVLRDRDGGLHWWTWAGAAANATLAAALDSVRPGLTDPVARHHNLRLGLAPEASREQMSAAAAELAGIEPAEWPGPQVSEQALEGKFAEMLPPGRAARALSRRLSDSHAAAQAVRTERLWQDL